MVSSYSISLVVIEQLTYITSCVILLKTFKKTRFLSHLLLGIGYLFWSICSLVHFATSFFTQEVVIGKIKLVLTLWFILNIFLVFGLILVYYSFIYFRTNKLHPIINIISFLGGALIYALTNPSNVDLVYSSELGAWLAAYDISVTFLVGPMLLFFTISFVLPLVNKFVRANSRFVKQQFFNQLFGLSIVIIWAIFSGFTSNSTLRAIRPFLLAIGWFFWSLTLLIDPFNIMISNAKINKLLITNKEGHPIYYKAFSSEKKEEKAEITAEYASALIEGVKRGLEQIVEKENKLHTLVYENEIIWILSLESLQAYVFGKQFDETLKTVLNVILLDIQEYLQMSSKKTIAFIDIDNETYKILNNMIDSALQRVLIL